MNAPTWNQEIPAGAEKSSSQRWAAMVDVEQRIITQTGDPIRQEFIELMLKQFDKLAPELQAFCSDMGSTATFDGMRTRYAVGFNDKRDAWVDQLDTVLSTLQNLQDNDKDFLSQWRFGFHANGERTCQVLVQASELRMYWIRESPVPKIRAEYTVMVTFLKERPKQEPSLSDRSEHGDSKSTYACEWPITFLNFGKVLSYAATPQLRMSLDAYSQTHLSRTDESRKSFSASSAASSGPWTVDISTLETAATQLNAPYSVHRMDRTDI